MPAGPAVVLKEATMKKKQKNMNLAATNNICSRHTDNFFKGEEKLFCINLPVCLHVIHKITGKAQRKLHLVLLQGGEKKNLRNERTPVNNLSFFSRKLV